MIIGGQSSDGVAFGSEVRMSDTWFWTLNSSLRSLSNSLEKRVRNEWENNLRNPMEVLTYDEKIVIFNEPMTIMNHKVEINELSIDTDPANISIIRAQSQMIVKDRFTSSIDFLIAIETPSAYLTNCEDKG